MNDKHIKFNSDLLFQRKNNHCGYKYCPLCNTVLTEEIIDGKPRLKCTSANCDFIFYQNPVPAAGAVIVQDEKVLLVKRAHPPRIGWWCFPAGFMEWDEHPAQTCVREIKEETGLEIRIKSLFEIYSGSDDPRVNAILILYLCEIIGGEIRASDDAEEVRFFHLDELPDKIAFESHVQALADYNCRFRNK